MSTGSRLTRREVFPFDTTEGEALRKIFENVPIDLEQLDDVVLDNVQDGDILQYNTSILSWENVPLKTINGESLRGPGDIIVGGGGGSGTVTSVALTAPTQFSISGSPVTTSGTLGFAWNNQVANRVLAGPTTGADAAPTFRALVVDDIPGLPPDQIRNFTPERLLGWGEVVTGSGNGTLITLGTGFEWSGDQLNLTTNLQGWSGVATSAKQDTLVSGTNIKTINSESLLGSTNISIPVISNLNAISDVVISTPTTNQVLTYDGTNWINQTPSGGGGLTHFTESVNTSAPNATVPVCALVANNAATNVDVVFAGKGTFALLSQIPDNATTGGNKRGTNAVDLQRSRNNANQVASGPSSIIISGDRNRASGFAAICIGGQDNIASGTLTTVVGGSGNNCSGGNSFIGGGATNTSSGSHSTVPGGQSNQALGDFSWVPGGRGAVTRAIVGAYAWSGAFRSAAGDNQCIGFTAQRTTTDATPVVLSGDRGTPVATNSFVLPNNSCWTGTVHITGRSSGGDVYYLRLDVVGARGASAATTAVKATNPAYTFTDAALVGVSATVVANTTLGSLDPQVTGLAATTIDWFAHFDAGNQIAR